MSFDLKDRHVADGRPAGGDPPSSLKGLHRGDPPSAASRGNGDRQDVHHRQRRRIRSTDRPSFSPTTKRSPPSCTRSSKSFSPTTRSNTSSATTITISPRPTSRTPTRISRKDSLINDEIDRMRHSATRSLLERNDVLGGGVGQLHLRHRGVRSVPGYGARPSSRGRRSSATHVLQAGWSSCSTSATTSTSPAAGSGSGGTS